MAQINGDGAKNTPNWQHHATGGLYSAELGITGIIYIWLLRIIDFLVASDSEPKFYVNVRLRRTH